MTFKYFGQFWNVAYLEARVRYSGYWQKCGIVGGSGGMCLTSEGKYNGESFRLLIWLSIWITHDEIISTGNSCIVTSRTIGTKTRAEKPAVPAIFVLSVRGASGQESISRALITLSTVEVILISLAFSCRKTDTKYLLQAWYTVGVAQVLENSK